MTKPGSVDLDGEPLPDMDFDGIPLSLPDSDRPLGRSRGSSREGRGVQEVVAMRGGEDLDGMPIGEELDGEPCKNSSLFYMHGSGIVCC